MSVQHFLRRRSCLLGMLSSSHTTYSLIRVNGSGSYTVSARYSHAVLREQSRLRQFDNTKTKSLGILHNAQHLYSATTMHKQNPQNIRLISIQNMRESGGKETSEKEDTPDEIFEEEPLWDDRFPVVHDIEVKRKGKNARWESLKAILTQHRDKGHRSRRVWITFYGCEPTMKELALGWPQDTQADIRRKLRDKSEDEYYHDIDLIEGPREFTVMEKTGVEGRRFWREVVKKGESNDEEEHRAWENMMRDEGFNDEIERQMRKTF